jgi:hypothetical protein
MPLIAHFRNWQSKTYGHLASTGSGFSGDTTGSLSRF